MSATIATSAISTEPVNTSSFCHTSYKKWMDWTSTNSVDLNKALNLNNPINNSSCFSTVKKVGKVFLALVCALALLIPSTVTSVFNSLKTVVCGKMITAPKVEAQIAATTTSEEVTTPSETTTEATPEPLNLAATSSKSSSWSNKIWPFGHE